MKKEEFKGFVRENPHLLEFINTGKMTWQKFYELYDIYGEDEKIWRKYKPLKEEVVETNNNSNNNLTSSFGDLLNMVKKIDLDTVKKSIEGASKAVAIIQGLTEKKEDIPPKDIYEPRPIYKRFED